MAKRNPGGTPATVALTRAGIDFTLHPYEHHDDATGFGDEAAEALGRAEDADLQDPGRRHRRRTRRRGRPGGAEARPEGARECGRDKKAAMADPAAAARSSGYVVGGISADRPAHPAADGHRPVRDRLRDDHGLRRQARPPGGAEAGRSRPASPAGNSRAIGTLSRCCQSSACRPPDAGVGRRKNGWGSSSSRPRDEPSRIGMTAKNGQVSSEARARRVNSIGTRSPA